MAKSSNGSSKESSNSTKGNSNSPNAGGGKSAESTKSISASDKAREAGAAKAAESKKSVSASDKTREYNRSSNPAPSSSNKSSTSGATKGNPSAKTSAYKESNDRVLASVSSALGSIGQGIKEGASAASKALFSYGEQTKPRVEHTSLKDNVKIAADTLSELGYKPHQIAGVIGRLQQESHQRLDPNAVRKNDSPKAALGLRDSIGIAQWNGTRQKALKDFAASQNKPWNDVATQVRFIDQEMKTTEPVAYKALQNAKNESEAVTAMMHYERPQGYTMKNPNGGHGYSASVSNAKNIFSLVNGTNKESTDDDSTKSLLGAFFGGAAPLAYSAIQGVKSIGGSNLDKSMDLVSESVSTPATANVQATPAKGIKGLLEKDDWLGVVGGVAEAVSNPVGFVLDSIVEGFNAKSTQTTKETLARREEELAYNRWNKDSVAHKELKEVIQEPSVAPVAAAAPTITFEPAALPIDSSAQGSAGLFATLLNDMGNVQVGDSTIGFNKKPRRTPFGWSAIK